MTDGASSDSVIPSPRGRTTPSPRYAVRPPAVSDAPVLGRIHVQIWREAYAGLMPERHLAGLDALARGERWRQNLSAPEPATTTLVGTCDGEPVGFVVVGPGRDDQRPVETELRVLNVLAAQHGTGLATQLLTTALGERAAYLWVLAGNARAVAFYRKHGFELDGGTKLHEPTGTTELRMVRQGARQTS
ncbi:MAG TPA: GNAT family N-acetyltransferase [Segeticoccus sp.]|uniref:GNAT family N-acetyltransferase n=1 Tax=Segeticoccus sp. TaxID=2706531 RepID=UPI002D7F8D0E|nr:GNAT family N-acetyltransferase [Segeticoccus sp.]HET8599964.1 GNAT family N-acetyltransferase [Segeticoccus sp.]